MIGLVFVSPASLMLTVTGCEPDAGAAAQLAVVQEASASVIIPAKSNDFLGIILSLFGICPASFWRKCTEWVRVLLPSCGFRIGYR
ncbi:hypothetical protein ABZ863_06705 [Saccharomonospora sp. NPDC046836]|uniref:hypothetical protein n=1 Tax=Saccharomonospora sp. NPDC046836 TaxID=3156921 RepID=UPI003402415A